MTLPSPADFDPVLHSGPRITIMSRMVIRQRMRFAALAASTTLTPGNLSTHLDVLVRAGYLTLDVNEKKVQRRKVVLITPAGDAAFRSYVRDVRALLGEMHTSFGSSPFASDSDDLAL
ncbi:MAG: transcriptional regulator [Candidatus Thermoplasmatota archaeon]